MEGRINETPAETLRQIRIRCNIHGWSSQDLAVLLHSHAEPAEPLIEALHSTPLSPLSEGAAMNDRDEEIVGKGYSCLCKGLDTSVC